MLFWKKKKASESGVSNVSKNGLLSFIRGNLFIPDPKIFWVKSSVKYLQEYLNSNKIETIISNDKMIEQILINLITNAIKYCDKDIFQH